MWGIPKIRTLDKATSIQDTFSQILPFYFVFFLVIFLYLFMFSIFVIAGNLLMSGVKVGHHETGLSRNFYFEE